MAFKLLQAGFQRGGTKYLHTHLEKTGLVIKYFILNDIFLEVNLAKA